MPENSRLPAFKDHEFSKLPAFGPEQTALKKSEAISQASLLLDEILSVWDLVATRMTPNEKHTLSDLSLHGITCFEEGQFVQKIYHRLEIKNLFWKFKRGNKR